MKTRTQSNCPLCHRVPAIPEVTRNTVFGQLLSVAFCRECEFYFLTEQPSPHALQEYYSQEYFEEIQTDSWKYWLKSSFAKMRAASQAGFILSHFGKQGPGRILEVGSCDGTFLSQFQNRGWEMLGLEFNDYMISRARDRFGLALQKSDVMDLSPKDGLYDIIAFPHVLEHMNDPVAVLEHCRTLLKPNGMIFIELPHSPLEHEAPQGDYSDYFNTTHLYDFRAKSLARLIKAAELESVHLDRFFYSLPTSSRSAQYQLASTLMKGALANKSLKGILQVIASVVHLNLRNWIKGDAMNRVDLNAPWYGLGDNLRTLARSPKFHKTSEPLVIEESPAKA